MWLTKKVSNWLLKSTEAAWQVLKVFSKNWTQILLVPKAESLRSSGSGVLLRTLDMSPRLRCRCLRLYWNSAYSFKTHRKYLFEIKINSSFLPLCNLIKASNSTAHGHSYSCNYAFQHTRVQSCFQKFFPERWTISFPVQTLSFSILIFKQTTVSLEFSIVSTERKKKHIRKMQGVHTRLISKVRVKTLLSLWVIQM